jgi:hypothetical protein
VLALRLRNITRTAGSEIILPLLAFGACAAGNLVLLQFYYWGNLDDWIVARLSLPFWWLLAVTVPIAAVHAWPRHATRAAGTLGGLTAAAFLAFAGPTMAARRTLHENSLDAIARWEDSVLAHRDPSRSLVISGKSPFYWLLRNQPSITPTRAQVGADGIAWHMRLGGFDEVFMTQHLELGPAQPAREIPPGHDLGPRFVLETIAERRFGMTIARVSRVTAVLPAPGATQETAPDAPSSSNPLPP